MRKASKNYCSPLLAYVLVSAGLLCLSCDRRQGNNHESAECHGEKTASSVYNPDNGDGTYTNPVIWADYSDPDVIRNGDDYYMTASSFNCVPGLPVLHSKDLVNWELTGYALKRLVPEEYYSVPRHGGGVWAPCLRYHNNEYYIFYPDPDFGIYMIKSKEPSGPWSEPVMVMEGKGFIDPSPLWDDDDNAYLVYAFAGSRAGVKSVLLVSRLTPDGTKAEAEAVMVFDGYPDNTTVEGPKFYKRNGYYYIFAPAGGVTFGWQLVLRSKSVFGPYEAKKVMHQGNTSVNGPHQGAWVTAPDGSDWFIHFQEREAYGRIVHLQPVTWVNDWPLIGEDVNNDGIGEPVASFRKPVADKNIKPVAPSATDEFNGSVAGLQWQWPANPSVKWGYMSGSLGFFRLNCIPRPSGFANMRDVPNMMLQKFPAEEFTATTSVSFHPRGDGEEVGLIIMGTDYQYISVLKTDGVLKVRTVRCMEADKGGKEETLQEDTLPSSDFYLRVTVRKDAICSFSYSTDGVTFKASGEEFRAVSGTWIGAKAGLFALRDGFTNDSGGADIDWFRISKSE